MKVIIENLGVLKKAEFELGDLTLICGHNNTGKTYATYALFGFLFNWRRLVRAEVSNQKIGELVNDGAVQISIERHAKNAKNILAKGCQRYTRDLPTIFASNPKHFKKTQFRVELELDLESVLSSPVERKIRSGKSELLSLSKPEGKSNLAVSLLADTEENELPKRVIKDIVSRIISEIIFGHTLV